MGEGSAVALDEPRSIHLVGVGGAGISGIAVILATMGHRVSGVDVTETPAWPALARAGVSASVVAVSDLFASAADADAELVAHSTAFPPTPEDRAAAEAAGRRILDRAAILGAICATRSTVAIAGTHGKTSTTAMLATLLDGVGVDPSFLIGAVPDGLGVAARWGGADGVFVVEADESDGSFLELGAATAVVTNIEEDHLDYWGDLDAIEAGFARFVDEADRSVVCVDRPDSSGEADERATRVAARHGSVTVGEAPEARHRVHDVRIERLETSFGLTLDAREVGPVRIGTTGRHHARNAAVAVVTAVELGVDPDAAVTAIGAYRGVARRFSVTGEASGVTVVDDYAHNPGKVHALIDSAVEAGWGRVLVVFQPHRYSRTASQGRAIGAALAAADVVAVTDVYAAGEAPIGGVSGRLVVDGLLDVRPWADVAWMPTIEDAAAWVVGRARPDDLVLTVGAGDVHRVGPLVLAALGKRSR